MMMIGGSNADFARRHVARLQARWRGAIHDAAAGVGNSFRLTTLNANVDVRDKICGEER